MSVVGVLLSCITIPPHRGLQRHPLSFTIIGVCHNQLQNSIMSNLFGGFSAGHPGKAKIEKDKVKAALQNVLEQPAKRCRRADAFIEFIHEHFNDAGINTYSNLKRLFSGASSVRQAIRVLNMCTLRRNRKFKYSYSKSALTLVDTREALKYLNQDIEELKAEDLMSAGLKFGPSGILVEGEYNGEPFPVFPDEGTQTPTAKCPECVESESTKQKEIRESLSAKEEDARNREEAARCRVGAERNAAAKALERDAQALEVYRSQASTIQKHIDNAADNEELRVNLQKMLENCKVLWAEKIKKAEISAVEKPIQLQSQVFMLKDRLEKVQLMAAESENTPKSGDCQKVAC